MTKKISFLDLEEVIMQLEQAQDLLFLVQESLEEESQRGKEDSDERISGICLLQRMPSYLNLLSILGNIINDCSKTLNCLEGGDIYARTHAD